MEDKLKAAITAYAEAQSKVLDRVFGNLAKTGSPSSADLAFCLPDDVITGLPPEEQYDAFLRKLRFPGVRHVEVVLLPPGAGTRRVRGRACADA